MSLRVTIITPVEYNARDAIIVQETCKIVIIISVLFIIFYFIFLFENHINNGYIVYSAVRCTYTYHCNVYDSGSRAGREFSPLIREEKSRNELTILLLKTTRS